MRKLYVPQRMFYIKFKDGTDYIHEENCILKYVDKSNVDDKYRLYCNIDEFINNLHHYVTTGKTLFTKRKYFYFNCYNYIKPYYYDDIDIIKTWIEYKDVDCTYTIEELSNQLQYEEYLQLVFDKENELKSVLLKENM